MPLHSTLGLEFAHVPYAFEYADSSSRTSAVGLVTADVGKFARQLDDNSIWMLVATTPLWVSVSSAGGSSTVVNKLTTNTSVPVDTSYVVLSYLDLNNNTMNVSGNLGVFG